MAVTFDSTFEKGINSVGASPFSFVSNAGTVTGSVGANSNRILIVALCLAREATFWGNKTMKATKGGSLSAMTHIVSTDYASGTLRSVCLFGMIAPDTGNITLEFSWDSGNSAQTVYMGAISLYNCDQATGWRNNGSDTGTTNSPQPSSIVTTSNGNIAVVAHGDNNASSITLNAGTQAWKDTSFNTNSAMGYMASTGATATIGWDIGSSVAWGQVKVDVMASGATAAQLVPAYTQTGGTWSQIYV